MADVIQFQFVKLLEARDLEEKTRDGKRTQRELIRKIKQIIRGVNYTNAPDEEIHEFIVKSFSIHGIVDTYNDLGYCSWKEMIVQMVEHEINERREEYGVRI